jgi:hypothetical protein
MANAFSNWLADGKDSCWKGFVKIVCFETYFLHKLSTFCTDVSLVM